MAKGKTSKKTLTLEFNVISIGGSYLAACSVGGFVVKGTLTDDPRLAIQSLFVELSRQSDASIGLELALDGTTLGELTSGD